MRIWLRSVQELATAECSHTSRLPNECEVFRRKRQPNGVDHEIARSSSAPPPLHAARQPISAISQSSTSEPSKRLHLRSSNGISAATARFSLLSSPRLADPRQCPRQR